MSQAGTPIGDLNSNNMMGSIDSESDIVNRIMNAMNSNDGMSQMNIPPAPSSRIQQQQMINDPNPTSMTQLTMDNGPATAHMIGNHQPTPADFGSLLPGHGGGMGNPLAANASFYNTPVMHPQIQYIQAPSQGLFSNFNGVTIFREMKIPLFVAILFAFMSLPVVNAMIGHYFPNLLKIGGDLTNIGLVAKSLLAGTAFWVLQRVLVPLVAP
jgi:hypothetical protein